MSRILFIINTDEVNYFTKQRVVGLINSVIDPANKIGLVQKDKQKSAFKGIFTFNNIYDIDVKEWDIFIITHSENLLAISKKIKTKPIIFISNGNNRNERFINIPNLCKIIVLNQRIDNLGFSIPTELFSLINIPPPTEKQIKIACTQIEDVYKVVFFVPNKDEALLISKALISVINLMPNIKLTIVTSSENIPFLHEISNSNISFTDRKDRINTLINYSDIVIASEEIAEASIWHNRLTIVMGINGLGGLVDSNNLLDFARTNFKGRIGGIPFENIPLKLLEYEIRYTLHKSKVIRQNGAQILDDKTYLLFKASYTHNWKYIFKNEIIRNIQLYKYISNRKQFCELILRFLVLSIFKKYQE